MEVGNPHPTIYVQNLNEKIRPEYVKQTLQEWLSPFGKIVSIVAKKRLALKGQAWIQFDTTEAAHRAIAFLQGKRMYGKTVTVRFAKYKSDSVSQAEGTFEVEKYHREQEKAAKARNPRPTRRQILQQLMTNPAMASILPETYVAVLAHVFRYADDRHAGCSRASTRCYGTAYGYWKRHAAAQQNPVRPAAPSWNHGRRSLSCIPKISWVCGGSICTRTAGSCLRRVRQ